MIKLNNIMKKNIEVETRGPLSKKEFQALVRFFSKHGVKKAEKDRVLIDYSTFLKGGVRNRQKDIRLRVTNNIPEIIIKVGKWGEKEQRKEIGIFTERGTFDTLVEIFGEIGLTKGMLCVRKSKVFDYKGIEFALVEVPGHSYYYEAEKMAVGNKNLNKITEEVEKVCRDLGLKIFNKNEFFAYVVKLNKQANEVFEYKKYKYNYFKKRFNLK